MNCFVFIITSKPMQFSPRFKKLKMKKNNSNFFIRLEKNNNINKDSTKLRSVLDLMFLWLKNLKLHLFQLHLSTYLIMRVKTITFSQLLGIISLLNNLKRLSKDVFCYSRQSHNHRRLCEEKWPSTFFKFKNRLKNMN